ncbi:MAG TPA: hypothetical protein VIJ89_05120, partial [Deferrimonas sp.]
LSGVCGRLMCCLIYEHDSYARQKGCVTCASPKGPSPAPAPSAQADDEEEMTARLTDEEEGTP